MMRIWFSHENCGCQQGLWVSMGDSMNLPLSGLISLFNRVSRRVKVERVDLTGGTY